MSISSTSPTTPETTTKYGGLVDAIGGVAAVVLAIVALDGVHQDVLVPIATIIFGAALLIQAGTMLSEYTRTMFPTDAAAGAAEFGGGGISALFLVGVAGIVLGVLALLGIFTGTLTSVAVIAFGGALLLSSNAVSQLYRMKRASFGTVAGPSSAGELLVSEMASGSATLQSLAGLTAIVLGILAVAGTNATVLTLVGLLVLDATVLLTGSTLSGAVMGFMEPAPTVRRAGWSGQPAE